MVIVRATAALALLGGLTACGSTPTDVHSQPELPSPSTYVVTGVTQNGTPRALVKDTQIRLRFADGRLTLTAGCNTMSGGYTLDGTLLRVSSLASTEMGCAPALMRQDSWLAGLFAKPVQLTTGADAAVISGSTVLAIADRKTVAPNRPLMGTRWLLDTVYDGRTASSLPKGQVSWIEFYAGARVHAFDGTNDGDGAARVTGNRISFGNGLGWTLVGCVSGCPVGDFSGVLSGTATYAIEENRLTITNGGHGLGFHAR